MTKNVRRLCKSLLLIILSLFLACLIFIVAQSHRLAFISGEKVEIASLTLNKNYVEVINRQTGDIVCWDIKEKEKYFISCSGKLNLRQRIKYNDKQYVAVWKEGERTRGGYTLTFSLGEAVKYKLYITPRWVLMCKNILFFKYHYLKNDCLRISLEKFPLVADVKETRNESLSQSNLLQ